MKSHSTIILYLLPLLLFLLPQTTYQIGFVQPLTPFGATFVNTKLPSIYNLHFSLSSGLRDDAYIRVKFANYTTLGTPTCLFDINPLPASLKATTAKACTVVGDSVYIKPGVTIASTDEIYWVIFLSQTIPDTPGYTNLFQVSTVSSTDTTSAVLFDVNPGFGNFLWGSYSNVGTLFLEGLDFGVDSTRNLQGAANDVQVHVRFNRAFTAKYSRILIVVDQPWKFGATNIVVAKSSLYDVAVAANQPTGLYTAPTIFKFEIINDQVVQILFDETFPEGREFLMTVTNIINPIAIASGKLRFYTTDYTSNSVLEANENTVIYTASKTIMPITIGLSAGVPYGTGPVKLYKNTEQYITISFPVGATTITAGTTIRYDFSTDNTPVTGTLFISPTYTPADGTKVAYVYGSSSITISNLGPLVAGTTVYIQTKMKFSKIQPNIQVKISILINNVVVKYGESDILPLETNANSALLNIYGQNGESGVLDRVGTTTSIRLSWYIDSRVTTTGSTVTIYSNKFITNAGSPMACTNGVAPTPFSGCSLTNGGAYSVFTMTSASGKNILPNGYYDITMTNLYLNKASNHQDAIYEFYIRIDRDGSSKTVQDLMIYAFVRPLRDQLTNLNQYHSLDVYANNLANFPSFIRVFGTSSALSTLTPTATENVVITINSFVSLANFLQVTNEGAFPCGSSLTINCVYVKGNPNALSTNPIDWDRVIITFPSIVISTAFNLYIPQFFKDTSLQRFEFIVGKYDTTTRIYQNTYLEPQYTTTPWRTTGFTVTASGLVSNEPNLYIDLRGQRAGVMIPSSAPITLSLESLAGYSPNWSTYYGASAVVITEWEFWNSQSTLTPVLAAYDPLSNSPQDATVYLRYTTTAGDIMNAVVYPVVASASPQKLFNIGQVEMPYSLDIPNYVVYMTDMYGYLTYYNTLINSGRNALISSAITDYNFKCKHMIQGYLNTYCTMTFTTNAKIDRQANIKISYTSAFITISQCSLSYVIAPSTTPNPVSSSLYTCSSALQEIVISFNMANRLPVGTYTLVFYGFDQGTGTSQGLTFSIWDANYGFIVEQTNYNYFLELAIPDVISIDSINYDYLNQDAISNFRLKFTLPRDIYPNEILEFDIGSDLQSNNKNTDRLSMILTNMNTNTRVQIYGALKSQILTVQFGQGVQLAAGSYEIGLLNLKTPSSHSNDKISIRLRRSTDNVFVMQSKESSFTSYPTLQATASTFISVVNSRFLCVGCMGEFTFQVKLANSYVDANSVIYLHFPSYYLPAIANQQAKLDCRFNLDPVVCDTQSDYPYRLRLTGSPLYLNPGDTFNIVIYGFIVPNIITDPASEQNLFFAVDSWFNGTFSEQSNVILPSLTNIKSGLGSMYFYNLVVSSTTVRDKVDHVLRVNTTVDIPIKSTISVTFTNDYSNLRYLDSLTCKLNVYIYGVLDTNYASTTCLITGQTVKFVLTKAISKVYSLELTINSVPTPPKVATVDPNQFVIAAFGVNENDVIAITRETLNSIYKVNFVDATNTIEAQSNNDIVITRGTYSDNIFIGTNGGKRIIQDVSITAVATGFTFVPSIIDFFVGDISHTFKVGCDQNVKLRTYPFNFTQTQDEALVNPYGDLFNVRVTVVDTPIVITVPATVTVPIGGSSLPIAVSLTNKPYKEVQILMDIDEEFYNGAFGVDLDYSSPSLNFTSTDGLKYISFFSTADIASFPSTFTVNLKLDGANYQSYQLSSDSITINIQSPASFGAATIQGSVGTIKKTQATFSITQANPGSEGMLLIQLSQDCASKQSLSSVKNILRNNSFATTDITTNGCTSRYLNMVYNTPATPVTLSLTSLTPETKYKLYVYFENKAKQSNSASPYTYSFSTLALDSTVKMTATFSTTVYLDQLNSMICFLLRLFQTRIVNVVDAGGLSCSSYIEPTNRFLSYPGYYFGNYANSFSFYLLPDPTLEIDASLSSVPLYFDASNHATTSFYTAASNENINFLSDFKLDYYFSYSEAKTSTGNVKMPVLQSFTNDIITVDGNSTIRMTNFKMSARGSVYAIAREIAKVTVDPEDEFTTTDTTTRIPKTPTTTQIYACQDWNGDSVDACGRAIIANDDAVELQLRNLKVNTMYIVYYVVANEYPIEPIFANDIQSFTVRVINNAGILLMGWITLLGCIMTLFW